MSVLGGWRRYRKPFWRENRVDRRERPRIEACWVPRAIREAPSGAAIDGDGRAVDDAGGITAEEQYDLRNVLRFGPFPEVGGRHDLAIHIRVDDARQNGI